MRFETFGIKHLLPLVKGMGVTLEVCLITLVLGTILGLMAGIALTSRIRPLRAACKAYVNIVRGIPLLVILFMTFYGIPLLCDVDVSQSVASIASLTVYSGAYIAEIVRGAIQSIPKGQTEAANALGMSALQRVRLGHSSPGRTCHDPATGRIFYRASQGLFSRICHRLHRPHPFGEDCG